MESMFKSFSTRLDKLSAKVETLASESAMKESQNEAMKRFGIVMDKLQGLEERISLVEKALAVQHPDGHMLPFSQVGNTITSTLQDVKQAAEQLHRECRDVSKSLNSKSRFFLENAHQVCKRNFRVANFAVYER